MTFVITSFGKKEEIRPDIKERRIVVL